MSLSDLKLFDCQCAYGTVSRPPFRYARDIPELLEEMDFCGIAKALVYHSGQRFGPLPVYNLQIVEDIRAYPRLMASWSILPPQTGELPSAQQFLAEMRARQVKVLRAFPDEYHFVLNRDSCGELLEAVTERRIPLFVKAAAPVLGTLLREFPNLTMVAVAQGPHSLERYLRPLVEQYPNFYLETSSYLVEGLIEAFCERYGHSRLLFGSGFPDNCAGGALLRLVQADIPEESKAAIAAGNLERLLREVAS